MKKSKLLMNAVLVVMLSALFAACNFDKATPTEGTKATIPSEQTAEATIAPEETPDDTHIVDSRESVHVCEKAIPFRETPLEQRITAESNGLYEVSFKIGTYIRTNTNHIDIKIVDDADNTVFETQVDASTLVDNAAYICAFDPVTDSQGRTFVILVSSADAEKGNEEAVWCKTNLDQVNNMYIDGELSEYKFAMIVRYQKEGV